MMMTNCTNDDRITVRRDTWERLVDQLGQLAMHMGQVADQIQTEHRVSRRSVDRMQRSAKALTAVVAEARSAPSRQETIH